MDLTSSSSASILQSVKERMREKLNGSLKAVKLQSSLAAKIKTKNLNNSSILKVSLKHNNKALACALTAEREKSRRLENDKMFLQKEVKMLHFQNALLRQNQSIVNKILKEIDVFMNVNLSAAIEISNTMESTDNMSLNETKSERFSQQSALTMDEDQGYRLTGVALRVPSNSVLQQKCTSQKTILDNEEYRPIVPLSPIVTVVRRTGDKLDEPIDTVVRRTGDKLDEPIDTVVRRTGDKLDEPELHTKESLTTCKENTSRDSISNSKVNNSILPLDEEFSFSNRNAQSGGYVTKRKKRSTVSRSGTMSKTSDYIQTRSSEGKNSSPSMHWELKENTTIFLEQTGLDGAERSYIDSVLQKDRLLTMSHHPSVSQKLDTEQSSYVGKDISNVLYEEQAIQSKKQMEPVLNEESDHQTVDGYVGQEKTVYEADMEMTSSESVSIIAVLPKKKTQASKTKSGIPVQKTGALRKVKKSVREKNKKSGCSVVSDSSDSNEKGEPADRFMEDPQSDVHDRRTYVLPGPVVPERPDVLDSRRQSSLEVLVSRESSDTGQIFSNDLAVLNGGKSEMTFTVGKDHWTEMGNIADVTPKKRKSRIKEATHMESAKKKKRKIQKTSMDQKQLAKEHDKKNESTEQMDTSKEINTIPCVQIKTREKKIQRQTYVVSTPIHNRVTNDPIAKADEVHYRRETFVIPEPNPLVTVTLKTSVSEEKNDAVVEPQNHMNSIISTVVKTENGSGTIKSNSEKELCIPTSCHGNSCENDKRVSRHSVKKASSGLFSELDKKKTNVLPSKQDGFRGEKATLVRESFVSLKSSQSNKASKFTDIKNNMNDSFMLDMVSESILENTMEFPSCAEFPSATNPESTFSIDMSLKSIPTPELPVSEDCSNKELSHGLPSDNVLDDSDHPQDTHETEAGTNRQCKVEDQSIEIHESAIIPFQDMTNKRFGFTKQSPKSRSEEDDDSDHHCRRRRKPVNYKEPSLTKKLRRGDKNTDSEFRSSTVLKGKTKQGRGRSNKKVKPEECRTEDT